MSVSLSARCGQQMRCVSMPLLPLVCSLICSHKVCFPLRSAAMLQSVVRRALMEGGSPSGACAPLSAAPPLSDSLPLLAEDARALCECAPMAPHALLAPWVCCAASCLLFWIVGAPGLLAAAALSLLAPPAACAGCPPSGRGAWATHARLALLSCAAPLAAAACFALLLLSHGRPALSPADAFAALWLLDLLRASLASAPASASALARLAAADARLSLALAPNAPPPPPPPPPPRAPLPDLMLAHLARPGALLLLAGPPSSGKSALCLAALHAAVAQRRDGGEPCTGAVAYAGAEPFLLGHASLRDNILFGRPFDPPRYAAVCEAASLHVLVFAPRAHVGGDLSRMCDGRPLPHAHRQLLALARCAYAQPVVCALDCRLSSLGDPGTLASVFERCVMRGPLAAATRVLVVDAGALHLLSHADCAMLMGAGGRVLCCGPLAALTGEPGLGHLLAAGGATRSRADLQRHVTAAAAAPSPRGHGVRRSGSWSGGTVGGAACAQTDEEGGQPRAPAAAAPAGRAIGGVDASSEEPAEARCAAGVLGALRRLSAAALFAAAHAGASGSAWWLALHLDGRQGVSAALALGVLAGGAAAGSLLLQAALSMLSCDGAANHAQAEPPETTRLMALSVVCASAALMAVACSLLTLAATAPCLGVSLLLACVGRHRRAELAWSPGSQAVAARRGLLSLTAALSQRSAAATVSLNGQAPRFGRELARLLDALGAAEAELASGAARAGVVADAAAAAVLAAALFAAPAHQGTAQLAWAVMQARWVGAGLRALASGGARATL